MRQLHFYTDEYYHVYNHAVEGGMLVKDAYDADRFVESLQQFNTLKPIGSIFERRFQKVKKEEQLVGIVCYILNPNHFHLLLHERVEGGIAKFLQRLSMGYSKYMNNRHGRKGSLYRGTFQARHVDNDDYLLHLSAYINLNDRVHKLGHLVSKLVRSSWGEYIGDVKGFCSNAIILDQFKSKEAYASFAQEALVIMLGVKENNEELKVVEMES